MWEGLRNCWLETLLLLLCFPDFGSQREGFVFCEWERERVPEVEMEKQGRIL